MESIPLGRSFHSASLLPIPRPIDTHMGLTTSDRLVVLVVENHAEVRELIGNLVSAQGWEALVASGVSEAVAILKHQNVDAIISDWELDDGDGRSLLLVADQMFDRKIPSVMISSYASDTLRREAIDAGAIDLLEKPFRIAQLIDALADHFAKNQCAPTISE